MGLGTVLQSLEQDADSRKNRISYRMPGIVIEVSATLVAMTIMR
jgi:hypothetical protein